MNIFNLKIRPRLNKIASGTYDCIAVDSGIEYSEKLWENVASIMGVEFNDLIPLGPQLTGRTSCPSIIYQNLNNKIHKMEFYNCWDAKDNSIEGTTIEEAIGEIERKTHIVLNCPFIIRKL